MKTIILLSLVAGSALAEPPGINQERSITISNITYTVKYELKNPNIFSQPLTSPLGQPHYDCKTRIFQGTNQIGIVDSQWTKGGCFEDSPMILVGQALNWKRFPNDSAGPGMHWVISGPAMWQEKD